ncbi:MAG: hypothetical protein B6244_10165 [Candidatus Cloacimonetes bacterium 4572_55]|nr:MAG: hypothetical protein B6244_10165 [Candidatus Cloacimonetes bacterium 4572_55]
MGWQNIPKNVTNFIKGSFSQWTLKIIYGMIILIACGLMTPEKFRTYHLKLDEISKEEIIAPFTFSVLKPDDVLARDQENSARQINSIVDYDSVKTAQILSEVRAFFDDVGNFINGLEECHTSPIDSLIAGNLEILLPISTLRGELSDSTAYMLANCDSRERLQEVVRSTIKALLQAGIIAEKKIFAEDFNKQITLISGDEEKNQHLDLIYDRISAFHHIRNISTQLWELSYEQTAYEQVAGLFVIPNLLYNQENTQERREKARKEVSIYQEGQVFKGEIILRSHERVTEEHLTKIRSLEDQSQRKAFEKSTLLVLLPIVGRMLAIILTLLLIAYYIYSYYPKLFYNNLRLSALTSIILLTLITVYVINILAGMSIYMIPFATAGMLFCVLFDSRLALRLLAGIGFLAAIMLDYDFFVLFFAVVSGSVAIYSVSKVHNRSGFYRPLAIVPIANILIILALNSTVSYIQAEEFIYFLGLGIVSGALSPVLAIGLLPIFESIFHISTDITLLELSNPNHPLLRNLALQAPGTFHHSLMVGNLSEAAARSIGANPLRVRVCSYYHDIGKMCMPHYFAENQRGKNPHDQTAPIASASIIKLHIKEGMRMAKEHRLPKEITDIIPQHHGTGLISFFYGKAKKDDPSATLNEQDFRYDGPKPQTKEAGIIMMADAVEAVSRLIEDPNPEKLKDMIYNITKKKFEESQLDECELTLKDIGKIRKSFLVVLTGAFHTRVDYPSTKNMTCLNQDNKK